ncbi:MAG: SHOCT domain-containing protein [Candidatus Binatia bacterium]|nr:SHOCT domain-containing protein [Candidatus Binatia bacterium]
MIDREQSGLGRGWGLGTNSNSEVSVEYECVEPGTPLPLDPAAPTANKPPEERLLDLANLKERGAITQSEFDALKAEILRNATSD